MKQFLSLVLLAALVLSLAACGGAVVDYDTPKSGELSMPQEMRTRKTSSACSGVIAIPEARDD